LDAGLLEAKRSFVKTSSLWLKNRGDQKPSQDSKNLDSTNGSPRQVPPGLNQASGSVILQESPRLTARNFIIGQRQTTVGNYQPQINSLLESITAQLSQISELNFDIEKDLQN